MGSNYCVVLTSDDQERFGLILGRAIDGGHPRGQYLRTVLNRMHRTKPNGDGRKIFNLSDAEHQALTDALMDATVSDYYWAPVEEDFLYPTERRVDRVAPYQMVKELE